MSLLVVPIETKVRWQVKIRELKNRGQMLMSALKSVVVREQIVSTLREVSNVNVAKAITVLAQYAQRVSVMMPSVQQTRSASRPTK